MQKRNLKLIVAGILILIFIVGINTAHSLLAERDQNIIKIAFMNGYIEGLKLSKEEKKKLENDKNLLAKKAESAAEIYLEKVISINR